MAIQKCNVCGSDLELHEGQTTLKCRKCGNTQIYNDDEIINEVDSLLHLYKLAIDGGVWSKPDSIFDHVQDIEYELPPEPEIPVDFDEVLSSVTTIEEPIVQSAADSCDSTHTREAFGAKAASFFRQNKRVAFIAGAVVCAAIVCLITFRPVAQKDEPNVVYTQPDSKVQASSTENTGASQSDLADANYDKAISLMEAGKYSEAISVFEAIDGYQDNTEKISECYYNVASAQLEAGDNLKALSGFSKAGKYKDSAAQAAALRNLYLKSLQTQTISAGRNHTVALKTDGTIVTAGSNEFYQCDVTDWTDIVSVAVGETHSVGLKADGTVVHAGAINYGQRNVTEWWDITAICAGRYHTVGLKADGTVLSAGRSDYGQCDVWNWQDITSISTGAYHTAGLKKDGTVVAVGNNKSGQCNVSDWTDIVAVYAGDSHTIGLKADGTAIAVGYNPYGQCDVTDWTNLVDIGIGTSFTLGLKADGTVVAAGYPYGDLNKVFEWVDIVDISVGAAHILGLKADGTVVTVNYDDSSVISGWTDIKLPG